MKFFITRTSDWDYWNVIEAEHLEDCIRILQECSHDFVVGIITEDDKANTISDDPCFDTMDGNYEIVHDEKRAEAYKSCDFEVEIYDDYRE